MQNLRVISPADRTSDVLRMLDDTAARIVSGRAGHDPHGREVEERSFGAAN